MKSKIWILALAFVALCTMGDGCNPNPPPTPPAPPAPTLAPTAAPTIAPTLPAQSVTPTSAPTGSITCLQLAAQDCLTACQGTAGACYANCLAIRTNSCNGGS